MQNRIKEISNFYTYLGRLQGGKPVAALIFPASMRKPKYPNSFRVNEKSGKIDFKIKNYKLIPNNVFKESVHPEFRVACHKNKKYLDTLTFESGMLWGFEQALVDWLYYLPSNYENVTIYGGEILNYKMLHNICNAMRRTPEKKMCIYTYNDLAVDYVRTNNLVTNNLLLFNSKEWDYVLTDYVKFDFPKHFNKFLVPASSKNFKILCKH